MRTRLRGAALLAVAALSVTACGKKGPPQPPIRILPGAAKGLKLRQIGSQVVLTAMLPMQETNGAPITGPVQVKILRMPATETLRPGAVSGRYLQHQFERGAKVIATLGADDLAKAAPGGRLTYLDASIAPAPAESATRLFYSVMIIDSQGKRSPLPVPPMVEIARAPAAPHDLKVEVSEGKVRLTWEPGQGEPPNGTFNVYRHLVSDSEAPVLPINPQPIAGTSYEDTTIVYGAAYRYMVRAVFGKALTVRESADIPEVEVRPLDVYPPKTPTGVAVSAEGSVIRVYWFPNSESDLAGYRIYRRETADGEFKLAGEVGPAETAFADATARRGVRYHYVVSAFDSATPANESPRSEERTETLPLEAGPAPKPRR